MHVTTALILKDFVKKKIECGMYKYLMKMTRTHILTEECVQRFILSNVATLDHAELAANGKGVAVIIALTLHK